MISEQISNQVNWLIQGHESQRVKIPHGDKRHYSCLDFTLILTTVKEMLSIN